MGGSVAIRKRTHAGSFVNYALGKATHNAAMVAQAQADLNGYIRAFSQFVAGSPSASQTIALAEKPYGRHRRGARAGHRLLGAEHVHRVARPRRSATKGAAARTARAVLTVCRQHRRTFVSIVISFSSFPCSVADRSLRCETGHNG
jgi:hypothetical protein